MLGVGLIGGSIGLAARARAEAWVVGYDPDSAALSSAVEVGAIDEPAFAIADAVSGADVVFVATPVGASIRTVGLALEAASAECVVSDVGSTKRAIADAIADPRFVAGHPLAGAEKGGVANARKDLFEGATWYLTPVVGRSVVESLLGLIEAIGARPVTIDPEVHDRLMASVSHLPHVLANVLVAQALRAVESGEAKVGDGTLGPGPSFRDATRVAGANTAIWTDIYMSNGDLLAEALGCAIEELERVRHALREGDAHALAAWNESARVERERLRRAGLVAGP